jgi:hypothetical protein
VPAVTVKVPIPLYAGVPPVAETVTTDVPPLQSMEVEVDEAEYADGCVIVKFAVTVAPAPSITVSVCDPALRLELQDDEPKVPPSKE